MLGHQLSGNVGVANLQRCTDQQSSQPVDRNFRFISQYSAFSPNPGTLKQCSSSLRCVRVCIFFDRKWHADGHNDNRQRGLMHLCRERSDDWSEVPHSVDRPHNIFPCLHIKHFEPVKYYVSVYSLRHCPEKGH